MGTVNVTKDPVIDMKVYSFAGDTNYDDIRVEIDRFYDGTVTRYKICDFTDANLLVSAREIYLLANQIRTRGTARRQGYDAIVVPQLVQYGFARMYVAYTDFMNRDPDALKLFICRSMDEAVKIMRKIAQP